MPFAECVAVGDDDNIVAAGVDDFETGVATYWAAQGKDHAAAGSAGNTQELGGLVRRGGGALPSASVPSASYQSCDALLQLPPVACQ
jgi:hypothetical protein